MSNCVAAVTCEVFIAAKNEMPNNKVRSAILRESFNQVNSILRGGGNKMWQASKASLKIDRQRTDRWAALSFAFPAFRWDGMVTVKPPALLAAISHIIETGKILTSCSKCDYRLIFLLFLA